MFPLRPTARSGKVCKPLKITLYQGGSVGCSSTSEHTNVEGHNFDLCSRSGIKTDRLCLCIEISLMITRSLLLQRLSSGVYLLSCTDRKAMLMHRDQLNSCFPLQSVQPGITGHGAKASSTYEGWEQYQGVLLGY